MQAKLFVTDMDGTLLNNEHKISKGNKHMIKRAVEAGVIFTIATGRMYASALPYAQELELDVPIITYNGALIKTAGGKELYASYLDEAVVKDLLDFAQECELYIHLYSDDQLYFIVMMSMPSIIRRPAVCRARLWGRIFINIMFMYQRC